MKSFPPQFIRKLILTALLTLFSMPTAATPKGCYPNLGAYFSDGGSYKELVQCQSHYCKTSITDSCEPIQSKKWHHQLSQISSKTKMNDLQRGALATYLSVLNWTGPIRMKKNLRFQTGPYETLELGSTGPSCLPEILEAARILETHFARYSFSIDGRIKNCRSLKRGVNALLLAKNKVQQRLNKFFSPLHTVYLTVESKFNHQELGAIGLYINVDKPNEIQRQLL